MASKTFSKAVHFFLIISIILEHLLFHISHLLQYLTSVEHTRVINSLCYRPCESEKLEIPNLLLIPSKGLICLFMYEYIAKENCAGFFFSCIKSTLHFLFYYLNHSASLHVKNNNCVAFKRKEMKKKKNKQTDIGSPRIFYTVVSVV